MIDRRQFLTMRRSGDTAFLELSCEALYMRFVDARLSGTTDSLRSHLEAQLAGARRLRLIESRWLACEELRSQLDPLLEAFRARNGQVDLA